MTGISKAISESLFFNAVSTLKTIGTGGRAAIKLQAIISAKEHGISLTAKVFGTSRVSLTNWINKFKSDGLQGLELKIGRGRKAKTDAKMRDEIKEMISKNPNIIARQVKEFLLEKHDVSLSGKAANNLLKGCGFSYITPRPRHYKAEQSAQDDFKKNSKKSKRNTQKRR